MKIDFEYTHGFALFSVSKRLIENLQSPITNSHYTNFIPIAIVLKCCVVLTNVIGFQFQTLSKKENNTKKKNNFLEFSKSRYKTSTMPHFDNQIIFGVKYK